MNATGEPSPQRRQLTVLFCDLVGSTALSSELDPEDLREVITAYRDTCTPIIARYDGFVQQYVGDGISVLFGYPAAHEDDAERAVYAGLGIVNAMPGLSASLRELGAEDLQVRIGIATGLVVAGERQGTGAAQVDSIIGETPNLAARLQNLAEPNSVIVGGNTHRLLGTRFEYVDMGDHVLKGFPEAINVFRVLRPSRARSRFEAARLANVAPMVDRRDERALLKRRWREASAGRGQTVLITGEPGIGKSRLTLALRDHLRDREHFRLRYQCSAYYVNSPLHPVIDQLVRAAGFLREDSVEEKSRKLRNLLEVPGVDPGRAFGVCARLLSLPAGAEEGELDVSAERLRELIFEMLLEQLDALAMVKPVLLVFEDVHWLDPTSRRALETAVEATRSMPVMIVATSRPGFAPHWLDTSHVTALTLERLAQDDGSELVERITASKPLPQDVVQQIVRQTDGVPLFVEELTRTVIDSGLLVEHGNGYALSGPLPQGAIPVTLQDSLMARLDRLGSAREVAQLAAVIGREFSHELLAAVAERDAGLGEDELADALARLIESGLLTVTGEKLARRYTFKHALVRDAAHESLLRKRRRALHATVAEALETRFRDTVATAPEVLAYHCQEAKLTEKAVEYWLQAGRRASENSANAEAVAHLRQGLALAGKIGDAARARALELELLIALGPSLISTEGPGSLAVERNYTRALELCKEVPRSPSHFKAHWGWWRASMNRHIGRERADTLLDLARSLGDTGCELQAHHCQWATLFHLGDHASCRAHVERGLALYRHREHGTGAAVYGGHDARVCGEGEHALSSWMLGENAVSAQRLSRCIRWGNALRHTGSVAHARYYALLLATYRLDAAAVAVAAPDMVAFATEHGLPDYRAGGLFFHGWAESALAIEAGGGGTDEAVVAGIERMRNGLALLEDIGTKEDLPTLFELEARIYARTGRSDEAMALVDAGFEASAQTGVQFWLAELHRCRAELLLAGPGEESTAEANLDAALATAQSHGAIWFELRAGASLARLRRAQGRGAEGRDQLSEILERARTALEDAERPPEFQDAEAALAAS